MSDNPHVQVSEVMTTTIERISPLDTVAHAMEVMGRAKVSSLVVDRRDDRDEYGILVVSDIARDVIGENRAAERVNVYEIMSKPVISLPQSMDIRNAVRLLVRFGISRALVVDDQRHPIGIVTLRDLVLRHGRKVAS
jgi:CBS domain-containing protein